MYLFIPVYNVISATDSVLAFLGVTFKATEFTIENSEEEGEEEDTDNEDIYSRIFCLCFSVLPVENFLSVQLYVDSTQGRAKSNGLR